MPGAPLPGAPSAGAVAAVPVGCSSRGSEAPNPSGSDAQSTPFTALATALAASLAASLTAALPAALTASLTAALAAALTASLTAFNGRFLLAQNRVFKGLEYESEGEWRGGYDFVQLADPQLGMLHWDRDWTEELTMLRLALQHVNRLVSVHT